MYMAVCVAMEGKRFTSIGLPVCQQCAGNNSRSQCVALFYNCVLHSCMHSHVCWISKGMPNVNYRVLLVVLTAYFTFVSFHRYTINSQKINKLFNICCSNYACYRHSCSSICCVTTVKVSKLLVTWHFKNCASLVIYMKKCDVSNFNFLCQHHCD
jgi:hypothetical protein